MTDRILILDFGSQVTQLIARRVRENGVYCEIQPFTTTDDKIRDFAPQAVILSGGPASVTATHDPARPRPRLPPRRAGTGDLLRHADDVRPTRRPRHALSDHQEFGRAFIDIVGECRLFEGLWPKGGREQVWMSHGDKVDAMPPGFRAVAASDAAPYAAIADDERRFYGVLFHPEVVHTPQGGAAIAQLHP